MKKRIPQIMMTWLLILIVVIFIGTATTRAATTFAVTAEGLNASGDSGWSGSGTSLSGSVTGTKSNGCESSTSATLTFTNTRDKTATLSFDYNITKNTGSVVIGSTTISSGTTGENSYSVDLEPNGTLTVKIESGKGTSNTTAITLTNISLVVDSSATTTFQAPTNGSYTVNGTAITAETQITQQSTESYSLVATPASGYKFLGWYSSTLGGYVSTSTTASVNVENDTTIHPVFVTTDTPIFAVGTNRYTDLTAANADAKSSQNTIILISSGTLATGTYEISSGVKLLIPYDSAYTATFSSETNQTMSEATVTMYSCLTLPDGVTINCYGSINVNAQQFATSTQYTGHVAGPYGAIQMDDGSQLNMKSGSYLYAYGYVGGDGLVWAESGSKVYQFLQVRDWRGGSDSSSLITSLKNNSFLFSQYYVQNIELPLRLDSGAEMYVSFSIAAGIATKEPFQSVAQLIGKSAGFFHVSDGYVMMTYDATQDTMALDICGTVIADELALSMKYSTLGGELSMNSSNYIMPLPMNYTVNVNSGSHVTFQNKFKLLPGTEVYVAAGATVELTSGAALYLYDVDDWKSGTYTYGSTIYQLGYVYANKGKPATRTVSANAVLQVDGTLTAYGPIYSTKQVDAGGNAGITGRGTIYIGTHGSTNLKEVSAAGSTDLTSITCVPAVGMIAGQTTQQSFALGYFESIQSDGTNYWYQYKLTGDNVSFTSGGVLSGSTYYTGSTYSTAATVDFTTNKECVTISGNNADLSDSHSYKVVNITPAVNSQIETVTINATDHSWNSGEVTTAPTCVTTGVKTYTCQTCNATKTDIIAINADAHNFSTVWTTDGEYHWHICQNAGCTVISEKSTHSYTSVVTEPTCTEGGYTTYTCSCGDSYVDSEVAAVGHQDAAVGTDNAGNTIGDFKCDKCNAILFYATNVNLGNNLDMLFAIPVSLLGEGSEDNPLNYTAKFTRGDTTIEVPFAKWTTATIIIGKNDGVLCYVITYTGFAAKDMGEYVTLTIYNGERAVSESKTDSIRDYAMRLLEKYKDNETMRTLLVDMLNYGAACKQYLMLKDDPSAFIDPITLPNYELTDAQKAWATQSVTIEAKFTPNADYCVGSNLITTSNIQFAVGFTAAVTGDKTYSFTNHWNDGDNGREKVDKQTSGSLKYDETLGCYLIDTLVVADARQEITITVYDSSGAELASWSDSIESYCARMIDKAKTANAASDITDAQKQVNLSAIAAFEAFMKFSDSAEIYLETKEAT